MLFNSFSFLLFFPVATLLYYLIPHKLRWEYLLLVSYGFYMNWNPSYALLLLCVTIVSYIISISINRSQARKKKRILTIGIIFSILPLVIFKYLNFINDSVFTILNDIGVRIEIPKFNLLLPVGISFFTFKAISYMVDVYKGKTMVEKNLGIYALYIAFFVDLAAGPIDRAEKLIPQLKAKHSFVPENVVKGLRMMLWGYFMKVMIADRITLYVDPIFNNLNNHSGLSVLVAAILFSIQIYCDFGGYSFIAIGCGKVMGFDLMMNFERPYMATCVTDFWRRWHISLSTWFRDYVYIPLGGNRCSKGRHIFNLLVTFTVSGLWHGANWTFVIWGFLNGLFQVIGKEMKNLKTNTRRFFKLSENSQIAYWWNITVTFVLMTVAWTFFKANSVEDAFKAVSMMFKPIGHLYLPQISLLVYIIIGCTILFFCDIIQEKKGKHPMLENKYIGIRFLSYIFLTIMILAVGVFDGGQFIYFQF